MKKDTKKKKQEFQKDEYFKIDVEAHLSGDKRILTIIPASSYGGGVWTVPGGHLERVRSERYRR